MIREVNRRVINVLNYIEENPESDPNAYEMVLLTFDVGAECAEIRMQASAQDCGYTAAISNEELTELRTNFFKMMEIRQEHLIDEKRGLGITKESPLYIMIDELKQSIITYNRLSLNNSEGEEYKKMCASLAGVYLYTKQRQRDLARSKENSIIYDNEIEFNLLKDCFSEIGDTNEAAVFSEIEAVFMQRYPVNKDNGSSGLLKGMVNAD